MLILSIIVKVSSPGPVFFKQKRVGKNCELFMIYKFRSMYTDAPKDTPTHLLKNPAAFITPIGRFLRKSSLDELPQIINILKGELTFVGPRPALWNQDDLVAERAKYGANDVTPGLTGLAQVRGRDELPIPVKAKYDGEYCAKISPWLDSKIMFLTAFSVFRSSGVVEGGTGAMEKVDDEVRM
jgi:O-antigen biosynthesis protein WbqP